MALLTEVRSAVYLATDRRAGGLLDGDFASRLIGRRGEFTDLREYVPGDEISDIDWKASARGGSLHVRRYIATRKHVVHLHVMAGGSMSGMADAVSRKSDLLVRLAGAWGYLALKHGDRVALSLATGEGTRRERPSGTEVELERMLHLIDRSCAPDYLSAQLAGFATATGRLHRRAQIMPFLVEDLDYSDDVYDELARLHARHHVLVMTVADIDPTPASVRGRISGLRGERSVPARILADSRLARELAQAAIARHARHRAAFTRAGIPYVHVASLAEAVPAVLALMRRTHERHRG